MQDQETDSPQTTEHNLAGAARKATAYNKIAALGAELGFDVIYDDLFVAWAAYQLSTGGPPPPVGPKEDLARASEIIARQQQELVRLHELNATLKAEATSSSFDRSLAEGQRLALADYIDQIEKLKAENVGLLDKQFQQTRRVLALERDRHRDDAKIAEKHNALMAEKIAVAELTQRIAEVELEKRQNFEVAVRKRNEAYEHRMRAEKIAAEKIKAAENDYIELAHGFNAFVDKVGKLVDDVTSFKMDEEMDEETDEETVPCGGSSSLRPELRTPPPSPTSTVQETFNNLFDDVYKKLTAITTDIEAVRRETKKL